MGNAEKERKNKVEERKNEEAKYKEGDFWMSIKNVPFKGYSLTLPSLVSFAAKTLKGEEINNSKRVQRKTLRFVKPMLLCFSQLSFIVLAEIIKTMTRTQLTFLHPASHILRDMLGMDPVMKKTLSHK